MAHEDTMKTLDAARIALATAKNGGFTALFGRELGRTPSAGFIVADGRKGLKIPAQKDPSLQILAIQKLAKTAQKQGFDGVGTWIDQGIVYVDPINYVDDFDTAERISRERQELAFWSLSEQKAIEVQPEVAI